MTLAMIWLAMEYTCLIRFQERDPELFIVVCVQHGEVTRYSPPLNEADTWGRLHRMGFSDAQIKLKMEARALRPE